uniref:Transmembrane protein n=1 Tax=Neospora caninum (strain Liverpool) TaxID=572307 RepID=A0A0F7UH58_NEOCL|nr:TPA: hypothetical protein BN1204_041105 [Neospora caninum Liverpool]
MIRKTDPVHGLSYSARGGAPCLPETLVKDQMTRDVAKPWTTVNISTCVVSSREGVWRVVFDYIVPVVILGEVAAILISGGFVLFMFLLSQACGAVICGVLFVVVTPWVVLLNHVTSAVAVYCASRVVSRAALKHPCEWSVRSFVADCVGVGTGSLSSFLFSRFIGAGQDIPLGNLLVVGLIRSASQTLLPNTRNEYIKTPGPFFLFVESLLLFLFSRSFQAATRIFLEGCLSFFQAPHFSSEVLRACLSSFTYSISECFLLPLANSKFSKHAFRCLSSAVSHSCTPRNHETYTCKRYGGIIVAEKKGLASSHIRRYLHKEIVPQNTPSWYVARRRRGTSVWQRNRGSLAVSKGNACCFIPHLRRRVPQIPESENRSLSDLVGTAGQEPSLPSCLVRALQDSFSCSIRTSTTALQGTFRALFCTAYRTNGGVMDGGEDTGIGDIFEKSLIALVSSALTSPVYLSEPSSHFLFGSVSSAFSVSFFCSLSVSFSSVFSQFLLDLEISAAVVENPRLTHLFVSTFCSTVWAGTLEAARQQLVMPPRFTLAIRRYMFTCRSVHALEQRRRRVFRGYHHFRSRALRIPMVQLLRGGHLLVLLVKSQQSSRRPVLGEMELSIVGDENIQCSKPS